MVRLEIDGENNYYQKIQQYKKPILIGFTGLFAIFIFFTTNLHNYYTILTTSVNQPEKCPLYDKLIPQSFIKDNSTAVDIIYGKEFRMKSIARLAGSVQVDTQIGDAPPKVDEEPEYYEKFIKFHKFLKSEFPQVYEKLEVEYVNTYGLILTWKGSESLKPLMLMAHQDVVPVQQDTLDQWSYPPFSGHYDGEYIYGRGASDCKNVLIAIMESIDLLIDQNFKPKRSIILAFGFDEESSGKHGAKHMGVYLEKKYGKNSVYAIVDEGLGLMPNPNSGMIMALPATGEKGYIDLYVNLTMQGGHSSLPPDHTSIGIMGQLVSNIESDQFRPALTTKNPFLSHLQCMAVYDDELSSLVRKVILNADTNKFANKKIVESLSKQLLTKYMLKTSQAIDIIKGGEKNNALPEQVSLAVNHRISVDSTTKLVRERFTQRVLKLAKIHDLEVIAFGEKIHDGKTGTFIITSSSDLDPAPVTPIHDTQWKYLAGTVRHVFEDLVFTNLTYPLITAPSLIPANTDTRHYWSLTDHIYRFSPFYSANLVEENNIHSVDERIRVDAHLQLLAFFYQYIQNVNTKDAGK